MIWWTFDKKKKTFTWNIKTTCPHIVLECFKHVKGLLKHGDFSWKFCSCNFDNIRSFFKNLTIFLIYSVPTMIFYKFEKYFLRTIHTLYGSLFHAFTHSGSIPKIKGLGWSNRWLRPHILGMCLYCGSYTPWNNTRQTLS